MRAKTTNPILQQWTDAAREDVHYIRQDYLSHLIYLLFVVHDANEASPTLQSPRCSAAP